MPQNVAPIAINSVEAPAQLESLETSIAQENMAISQELQDVTAEQETIAQQEQIVTQQQQFVTEQLAATVATPAQKEIVAQKPELIMAKPEVAPALEPVIEKSSEVIIVSPEVEKAVEGIKNAQKVTTNPEKEDEKHVEQLIEKLQPTEGKKVEQPRSWWSWASSGSAQPVEKKPYEQHWGAKDERDAEKTIDKNDKAADNKKQQEAREASVEEYYKVKNQNENASTANPKPSTVNPMEIESQKQQELEIRGISGATSNEFQTNHPATETNTQETKQEEASTENPEVDSASQSSTPVNGQQSNNQSPTHDSSLTSTRSSSPVNEEQHMDEFKPISNSAISGVTTSIGTVRYRAPVDYTNFHSPSLFNSGQNSPSPSRSVSPNNTQEAKQEEEETNEVTQKQAGNQTVVQNSPLSPSSSMTELETQAQINKDIDNIEYTQKEKKGLEEYSKNLNETENSIEKKLNPNTPTESTYNNHELNDSPINKLPSNDSPANNEIWKYSSKYPTDAQSNLFLNSPVNAGVSPAAPNKSNNSKKVRGKRMNPNKLTTANNS